MKTGPTTVMHEIDLSSPHVAPNLTTFSFGTSRNPAGIALTVDGVSILQNGRRITPVMGEIHYARYPRSEWREALLKMKAGGVDVIASYCFWIHHEEIKGQWDFTGDRDLRAFVQLCGELGLRCVIRCGPWCHGEVRNGGLPEWLIDECAELRTDHPRYLAEARRLFAAIAEQLHGLLWKNGGPVIGLQIENEYSGDPQHLLTLKQIAISAGLDVPLYTRTGWPELTGPMPFGHLLPLFGGYAEGFWDRALATMPGPYWKEFVFKKVRTDAAIANEQFGMREVEDAPDVAQYPYLTCEIGGGMPCSYHRRITVFSMDALSIVIVKLGSGSNSPGYYMYHGGTNPIGREPWLQEYQATRITNWNDLPVKSYDFQTCIGEFGQVREQYHLLRPLHLFLNDFGHRLAPMASVLPAGIVAKGDTVTLRWAVRTDGQSGFVFVNNYHRLTPMPARSDVQLKLKLDEGELTFPQTPVTIAANSAFAWPFNFDLGDGITLIYATAQVICQVRGGDTVYSVFAQTHNTAEFSFAGHAGSNERLVVENPNAGTTPIVTLQATNGAMHCILLLDETLAKQCYKGIVAGRDRLVISPANVVFDGGNLRLTTQVAGDVPVSLLPAPSSLSMNGQALKGAADGVLTRYTLTVPQAEPVSVQIDVVREAGVPREVSIGLQGVAEQPKDSDFDQAAVWQISLSAEVDCSRSLMLRIHYSGDVARAYLGDRLLTDNFYNGTPFEIGLNRYGPEVLAQGITLKILPIRAGAPIYMLDDVRPDFAGQPAVVSLHSVEVAESFPCQILAK